MRLTMQASGALKAHCAGTQLLDRGFKPKKTLVLNSSISDQAMNVKDQIDLNSIHAREAVTRPMWQIEEFCDLAGCEHIHKGLTSRDLTENVEQLQVIQSLELIQTKVVAALGKLAQRATEWKGQVITARTHNVPAQPTPSVNGWPCLARTFC